MGEKLTIIKRSPYKGDDGYRVFSIRIKDETAKKLEEISVQANRSRNELINIMLEYCIDNCEIKTISDTISV